MLFHHPEFISNFMYIYEIYHVVLHADFMYFFMHFVRNDE